jgi:glycosyltransferase involved in cell wall biosynthesis
MKTRIYLDGYSYDLRTRNSDWSYVEKKMPRVADWAPEIEFVRQRSRTVMLRANLKAVRATIGRRIGMPVSLLTTETDLLDPRELARARCDVVFSHRGLTLNSGEVPVVWMNAILDPRMTAHFFGTTHAAFEEEVAMKGPLFRKAAAVQVCSEAEAERHRQTFPDIADRFHAVPLFGPHLLAAHESILEKHLGARPVNLLFVGNQAERKGLPEALEAYRSLPEATRKFTSFTIVSHFDRSSPIIPNEPQITVHRGLGPTAVMELMRRSHILVNVAHHESYGMIFLEAMSQGVLCLGPDWEVQREILADGAAGVNLPCDAVAIRAAMLRSIEDEDWRLTLATMALRRFNERFAPAVVAHQYAELFRSTAAGR